MPLARKYGYSDGNLFLMVYTYSKSDFQVRVKRRLSRVE